MPNYSNRRSYLFRSDEIISLILFGLAQLALIPCKSYFIFEEAPSFTPLFGYECVAISAILAIYFLLKKTASSSSFPSHKVSSFSSFSRSTAHDAGHSSYTSQSKIPPVVEKPQQSAAGSKDSAQQEEQKAEQIKKEDMLDTTIICTHCKTVSQEKERLFQEVQKARENEQLLQQKITILEEERTTARIQCEEREKKSQDAATKLHSLFSLCRQLSHDIKLQYEMLDKERKKHAIEIRTLLKKHDSSSSACSLHSPHYEARHILPLQESSSDKIYEKQAGQFSMPYIATSVESTMSCFLAMCHEGLQGKSDWPSQEHPHLVRRKLYDSILKLRALACGASSLHSPMTEMTLTLNGEEHRKEIGQIIQDNMSQLWKLDDHEPLYIYGSSFSSSYIFFRCQKEPVQDIVIFGYKKE